MDMDPLMPKAVWGFNGTERPGAVYLAAVLAGHTQKGLPAFGIYGRDVQDAGDTDHSRRRAGEAAALRARGSGRRDRCAASRICRWAASRWASPARSSTRLSSRTTSACASRCVDMTEFVRRMEREHLRPSEEYERAYAWVRENCKEGKDCNPPEQAAAPRAEGRGLGDRRQDGADRPRPDDRQSAAGRTGLRRGGAGPQRDRRRLPGPAPVDRPLPQRRLHGGDPQLLVRLERHPRALHRSRPRTTPERRVACCSATC